MINEPPKAADLSSFDDMLEDRTRTTMMGKEMCSLCFAIEGVMTTLFAPPEFDWPGDNSIVDSPDKDAEREQPPMSPKKVCKLWKTKRKAEKQRLLELRQQHDTFSDHELASETKQSALKIQRTFEKRFDENDYTQRYERYGSRALFIRDLNQ